MCSTAAESRSTTIYVSWKLLLIKVWRRLVAVEHLAALPLHDLAVLVENRLAVRPNRWLLARCGNLFEATVETAIQSRQLRLNRLFPSKVGVVVSLELIHP